MKRSIIGIFFCFIFTIAAAQENPVIENGQTYKRDSVKTFLADLHDKNDYVLTFRYIPPFYPESSNYFVLTKKGNELTPYTYNVATSKLEKLNIQADSAKLLWKAFTDFELFKIKDQKELFVFCPQKYDIQDSYYYEFFLLSGNTMKKLLYYDPEYYDRWCAGMKERKNVINSVSLIRYVLNN